MKPPMQFVAVNIDPHGVKKWRRPINYPFAALQSVVRVVGAELSRAALSMPIAFSEHAGRYTLVAVLSLAQGKNSFVDSDGRWLGGYIPAWLRVYPFCFLPQKGGGEPILSVDEGSGLVVDGGSSGEAFFDADGKLSPALKPVVDLLRQVQRSQQATDLAVSALAQVGVIKPWHIRIKSAQGEKTVSGLHHVDEAAFTALADEAFMKLRAISALPIAYAQILSEGQLSIFAQLARLHQHLKPPAIAALPENIDTLFQLPADDTIKFQ